MEFNILPPNAPDGFSSTAAMIKKNSSKNMRTVANSLWKWDHAAPFPVKLYDLLEMELSCFSWEADGIHFRIHNPAELQKQLGTLFKTCALASFKRQLNMYEFKIDSNSAEFSGAYKRTGFGRGKRDEVVLIKRKSKAEKLIQASIAAKLKKTQSSQSLKRKRKPRKAVGSDVAPVGPPPAPTATANEKGGKVGKSTKRRRVSSTGSKLIRNDNCVAETKQDSRTSPSTSVWPRSSSHSFVSFVSKLELPKQTPSSPEATPISPFGVSPNLGPSASLSHKQCAPDLLHLGSLMGDHVANSSNPVPAVFEPSPSIVQDPPAVKKRNGDTSAPSPSATEILIGNTGSTAVGNIFEDSDEDGAVVVKPSRFKKCGPEILGALKPLDNVSSAVSHCLEEGSPEMNDFQELESLFFANSDWKNSPAHTCLSTLPLISPLPLVSPLPEL